MFYRLAGKGKGKTVKAELVPFKQASPMKKAPAAQGGTFYGTIGGKILYVPVRYLPPVVMASDPSHH